MSPRIERALQDMGDPPGASYLRYIYAVQQLDADAAVEHLHRFFDFGVSGRAVRGEGRDRPVFHWALLNLTSLHYRFGFMAPALLALEEAVRLAQHASDHDCLAAALLWLVPRPVSPSPRARCTLPPPPLRLFGPAGVAGPFAAGACSPTDTQRAGAGGRRRWGVGGDRCGWWVRQGSVSLRGSCCGGASSARRSSPSPTSRHGRPHTARARTQRAHTARAPAHRTRAHSARPHRRTRRGTPP
jgi:hypothetical protein